MIEHRQQFPRGKTIKADTVTFLVSKILHDAQRGGSSRGVLGFGDFPYQVTIRRVKWRTWFFQFWRPKR